MSDGGKGSKPRPYSVSQEEYDNSWNAIFGPKKRIVGFTVENDKRIVELTDESSSCNTNYSK